MLKNVPSMIVCCAAVALASEASRADGNPMMDSLPREDGQAVVQGLHAPVQITRDDLAIPVIEGDTLQDVIAGQGYLHGQERFVQMDLARRLAAGELSELVGPTMLDTDRRYRTFRFRDVARRVVARMSDERRAMLEAYVRGVNAGVRDLEAVPPEYLILQARPAPWVAEDSVLVVLMMFDMLQNGDDRERMIQTMREALPGPLVDFLLPMHSRFDVPLMARMTDDQTTSHEPMKVPGPEVIDLRRRLSGAEPFDAFGDPHVAEPELVIGSNNWAVAGSRSRHGGAILANDMHLALTSPGIWYRAELRSPGVTASGLTLPGVPGLVTGSNGHVAWGFTNTQGDFQDNIIIESDGGDTYRTPDGPEQFETITETINVRGRKPEILELRSTRWGVVTGEDRRGRPLVLKWTALMPEAINLNELDLLEAQNIDEAVEVARTMGIPSQNVMIAGATGRIAWVVTGYLPRRRTADSGLVPHSWANGTYAWDGPLPEALRPVVVDPKSGILYSANNRTIADEHALDIGYAWASGFRANRIAELLNHTRTFDERDLLAMQLDTRVEVFDFYRDLILEATDGDRRASLKEIRDLVEHWNGTADVDQSALRLLDAYRRAMHAIIFAPLTEACRELDPGFSYRWSFAEETLRRILEERPAHLLPRRFADWDELLEEALTQAVDELARRRPDLPLDAPWGEVNKAAIGHPLAELAPQMAGALRMPADPLPGHWTSVRMATPRFGASARMVVSPGREELGFLHMPSGQSGHPMSPHFRDGHAAWVRGLPTPFLPGESVNHLELVPDH